MNLTFNGFLKKYCKELAGVDTLDIKKLAKISLYKHSSVKEPLLLLCLTENKGDYLLKFIDDVRVRVEYKQVISSVKKSDSIETYLLKGNAPDRYAKVYRAFLGQTEYVKNSDIYLKKLFRKKISEWLKEKDITCYKICKDLKLNVGNVYAYVSSGYLNNISIQTAKRIYDYIEKYVKE